MQTGICLLSVVPMRSEPSHRSEMVSQLLFGEFVTVEEEREDFVQVRCLYDGYRGWVQASQLTVVADNTVLSTERYTGAFIEEVCIDGHRHRVPFGTPIYAAENSTEPFSVNNRPIEYNVQKDSIWKVHENSFSKENLESLVRVYLDVPYLWGGKSVYGIDCSGFVQQVFKLFGVKLLRDAYLQAGQGRALAGLEEAGMGDLVFFQNEKGRVVHVGILLDQKQIAHASGIVRIDPIDGEGILHKETGKRTHHFHSIRRIFIS